MTSIHNFTKYVSQILPWDLFGLSIQIREQYVAANLQIPHVESIRSTPSLAAEATTTQHYGMKKTQPK